MGAFTTTIKLLVSCDYLVSCSCLYIDDTVFLGLIDLKKCLLLAFIGLSPLHLLSYLLIAEHLFFFDLINEFLRLILRVYDSLAEIAHATLLANHNVELGEEPRVLALRCAFVFTWLSSRI